MQFFNLIDFFLHLLRTPVFWKNRGSGLSASSTNPLSYSFPKIDFYVGFGIIQGKPVDMGLDAIASRPYGLP